MRISDWSSDVCSSDLSTTFFPGWLRGLHDEHEAGTITLIADHMVACERFMLEGKADFLLCHHHTAAQHRLDPAGFTSLALGEDVLMPVTAPLGDGEIGRASCRERVCQYV